MAKVKDTIHRASSSTSSIKYQAIKNEAPKKEKSVVVRIPTETSFELKQFCIDYEKVFNKRLYSKVIYKAVYNKIIKNFEEGKYSKVYEKFIYQPKKAEKVETKKAVFFVPNVLALSLKDLKTKEEKKSESKYSLSINQIFSYELKKMLNTKKNEL